jgi:hypothetical protein
MAQCRDEGPRFPLFRRGLHRRWTTSSILPLSSIMVEIGIVFAAVVYILNTIRRASAILRHETDGSGSGEIY